MSERMDRTQKGQMKAKRQRHVSVLLVFNRDYFPFAELIAGGKASFTCKTGATEDESSH